MALCARDSATLEATAARLRAEDEVVLISTASALKAPHLRPEAAGVRHVQPGEPLVHP